MCLTAVLESELRFIRLHKIKTCVSIVVRISCLRNFKDLFFALDFIEERHDSNSRRRKKFTSSKLKCRYLKSDAVQSVFHNAPAYLSSPSARPRLSAATATASSRRKLEAQRLATMQDAFDAEDSVVSLTPPQIQDKLTTDSAVPRGFQVALVDGMLIIYRVQLVDCLPEVQAS